jgi:hypothetical protein
MPLPAMLLSLNNRVLPIGTQLDDFRPYKIIGVADFGNEFKRETEGFTFKLSNPNHPKR